MGIEGTGLKAKNPQLRVLLLIFGGIIAMGSVLYWRATALQTAEYIDYSPKKQASAGKNDDMRSSNFQLEVQESSPSVR